MSFVLPTIAHRACTAEGAPLPEIHLTPVACSTVPRPIVSFRIVIRETGRVLRRSFSIDKPEFGKPEFFPDQLLEFPSEETAKLALDYVRYRCDIGQTFKKDQIDVEAEVWAGITPDQENSLLARIEQSMSWLGWTQMRDVLTDARRGYVGVARRDS